jgi:hypothetical protein
MDGDSLRLSEAMNGPHRKEWMGATMGGLTKLEEHRTWEYVDRPRDGSILPCSFILHHKCDEHNNIKSYTRLNSSLVATANSTTLIAPRLPPPP